MILTEAQIQAILAGITDPAQRAATEVQIRAANNAAIAEKNRLEAIVAQEQAKDRPIKDQIATLNQNFDNKFNEFQARHQAELEAEKARRRAAEVAQYRERKIAEAGQEIIPGMVYGSTEAEIDASIAAAKGEFQRIKNQYAPQNQRPQGGPPPQGWNNGQPAPQGYQGQPLPPGYQGQPPQYGPTGYQPPPGTNQGFPTAPNPPPVPQNQGGPAGQWGQNISGMTTEQAVRSGAYGQNREQLHANLRNMNGNPLGTDPSNLPRHMTANNGYQGQQYVNLPGGVQQPVSQQMGPVNNPRYPQYQGQNPNQQVPQNQAPQQRVYQPGDVVNGHQWTGQTWVPVAPQNYQPAPPPPPQYQPPPPPPGGGYYQQQPPPGYNGGQGYDQQPPPGYVANNGYSPSQNPYDQGQPGQMSDIAAAQAAVARTHAGQNPVMGQNQGGPEAVRQTQAFAHATGRTPQSEYQQRFADSPPIG